MKKVATIILIALLVVSVYLFLHVCSSNQDPLMEEFTEYLQEEAMKQGVTAEYLLESGQITFEQWQQEK